MKALLTVATLLILVCVNAQDTTRFTVQFATDSSAMLPAQKAEIDSLLAELDNSPNSYVYQIQGHTDNVGDHQYNLKLSERRCESVKQYLLSKGVNENRISFKKYSYDAPLTSNKTEEGRASNRRATLNISLQFETPDWNLPEQVITINSSQESVVTTKNGCVMRIPPHAFQEENQLAIEGDVQLRIVEYNDPADFIASGLPMSYEHSGQLYLFNSVEMFSVRAFQTAKQLPEENDREVQLKNTTGIQLTCPRGDTVATAGFYKFNLKEQAWFEETKAEKPIKKVPPLPDLPEKKEEAKKEEQKGTEPEKTGPEEGANKPKNDSKPGVNSEGALVSGTGEGRRFSLFTINPNSKRRKMKRPVKPTPVKDIPEIVLDTTGGSYHANSLTSKSHYERSEDGGVPCYPFHPCDIQDLYEYFNEGVELSKRPLNRSVDTSWTLYFDQRFLNFNYSGTRLITNNSADSVKTNYPIRLSRKEKMLGKRHTIKIRFDKHTNAELAALKNVKWTFVDKENSIAAADLRKMRFSDIRVSYNQGRTVELRLKGEKELTTVILRAAQSPKKLSKSISRYDRILAERRDNFDRMEKRRAEDSVLAATYRHMCFYQKEESFFYASWNKKQFLGYEEWVTYFNQNLNALNERYEWMKRNVVDVRDGLDCTVDSSTCCWPFKLPCCDSVKRIYREPGDDARLVISLGIYNYDEVISLKSLKTISSPVFLDKKGRPLKVREAFLIVEGVNGMVRLDNRRPLRLPPDYRNVIFVVDDLNRRFKYEIHAKSKNIPSDGRFKMIDITDQTETLEGLKSELKMN